ncbi:MAG: TetR/AcrR family transcriptional regulator [Clostridia bacterium]|nr:TetR/AcrR family transcriptional regulator [Clostridia bacterium]
MIFIVQIKKDEVRNAILCEAEKEFIDKGFANASVRKIVKLAGTTIGNFYNYFRNKEDLFGALVDSEYKKFIYFIENHDKVERPDYLWQISDVSEWRKVLQQLLNSVMPSFSDRFVLLIESSKGTRYENTRMKMIDLLKDHFAEHMNVNTSINTGEALGEIIAEQILNGVVAVLKRCKDEQTRKELLAEYMLLHFIGVMGLLGNWK